MKSRKPVFPWYTPRGPVNTTAIILAAGRSRRMGLPKALLIHTPTGNTFVSRLIGELRRAGIAAVLVVARPDDAALRTAVEWEHATLVVNARADDGQLSSLLAGLAVAEHAGADAVLVTPVDVPLVTSATMRAVLDAAERSSAVIVRAVHAGRHGHPVVFKRAVFEELRRADPSSGAKAVVRADPARVLDVETEEPGVAFDLDTPEDYARAFGRPL